MIASLAALSPAMRRAVVAAVVATTVATAALVLVALVLPARAALALHWYLVVIGAIAVVAALRALLARYPVRWSSAPGPAPRARPPELPARLRAIARLVTRSRWDPAGVHLELRPILRAIAAQRLASHRTIDLETNPDAARAALGERVWAFFTPVDLETARAGGGLDPAELRAVVERLETLHDRADD